MASPEDRIVRWLRQLAHGFRRTLLHPQWLAFRFKERAAQRVAGIVEGDVLDIGCADASLRQHLRATVRYIGLDYPATATHLYHTRPSVYGDAQYLPFAKASFDHVVLLDVLEHLPRPDECMNEIARVLRPGGALLVHVPFGYPLHDRPFDFWRVTEHGLQVLAERAGMSLLTIENCGHAIETSGLLLNLSLTQALVTSAKRFPPMWLLALLLAPTIATINGACWLLSRLSPPVTFLPVSYWAVMMHSGSEHQS